MKYVVIALLALILGGLIGRSIWGEKKPEAVDPVQVILTQVRTHAVIEHERQIAIWYRACPSVLGKTPTIFIAWPAKLIYQMELADVQIQKVGTVIKVTTPIIHAQEPAVPSDFVDYMSTTSIFTFANEQGLVNQEIHKASPIARYLTTYFLYHDPSLQADFTDEIRNLVERLSGALGVQVTAVEINTPQVELKSQEWPKLPRLELCSGTMAAMNGLPFAKNMDNGDTVPIGFHPLPSLRSLRALKGVVDAGKALAPQAPQGTVTTGPPAVGPGPGN